VTSYACHGSRPLSDVLTVSRDNLSIRAYQAIRSGLMSGRFQPGQKLLLRSLATELGISVTPVREALLQLLREQALITDSSRSLAVPVLTRARYLEVRDLRAELEGRAAAAASRLIAPARIEALAAVHQRLAEAKAAGDFRTVLAENERFHLGLYQAADMPVLSRIIESLWVQVGPLLNRLYEEPSPTPLEKHEHLAVLRGLRARDEEMVREAIRRDIVTSSSILEEKLARDEQRG
jgi:GntR family transcriptional regulator, colanic acid and biofilm gene transcriptional regulator